MSETSQKTVERLREQFPEAILDTKEAHGEMTVFVDRSAIADVMRFLREDGDLEYNYLVDVTALDLLEMPEAMKRFDARFAVIYHLYSYRNNARIRLKAPVPEGETIPSVTPIWRAANWLEREVYDMFGIVFADHPDLTRILMPDDFKHHPLRKDYPLRGRGERASFNFDAGQ